MQPSDTRPTPVTVAGLGLMGRALADAFLSNGHPTTVWNRSAGRAESMVADGAVAAGSAREAVAASALVVVCVTDYEAVQEVLEPVGDLLSGRTLVNLASGTSQQARDMARWAAQRGGDYLDGAIMAVPPAIGTGDAAILYSGPQPTFDRHEPALRSLAGGTTYLGDDPGLSSLHDVALLGLMWSILNGFLQGAALVGTAGVDAVDFSPLAEQLIETVAGWLSGYSRQIDEGIYPATDATIETHLAAMEHLIHESETLGVNADLPRSLKDLAGRAVKDGRAGSSYAAMIEQFRAGGWT